jgi:hypothetical protein
MSVVKFVLTTSNDVERESEQRKGFVGDLTLGI